MTELLKEQLLPEWYGNLAVSPVDGSVLTGSMDHTVRLWDLETCREVQRFVRQQGWPLHVAFSGDGTRIVTGCESDDEPTARIWDVKNGQELHRLHHRTRVRTVAFSKDGKSVLTGAEDRVARLWDAASGELVSEFGGHFSGVKSVVFLPDDRRILTGSGNDVFLWSIKPGRWDITSDQCIRMHFTNGLVQGIAASPDGRSFAVVSEAVPRGKPGALELVDIETWELLMYQDPAGRQESVYCTAFSSDGARLVTGHVDMVARVWDLSTHSLLGEFRQGHLAAVQSCQFLADGERLLSCCRDARIQCWDIASGKVLLRRRLVTKGIISDV